MVNRKMKLFFLVALSLFLVSCVAQQVKTVQERTVKFTVPGCK